MDDGVRLPNRSRSYTPEPAPARVDVRPLEAGEEEGGGAEEGWWIGLAVAGVLVVGGVGASLWSLPRLRTEAP